MRLWRGRTSERDRVGRLAGRLAAHASMPFQVYIDPYIYRSMYGCIVAHTLPCVPHISDLNHPSLAVWQALPKRRSLIRLAQALPKCAHVFVCTAGRHCPSATHVCTCLRVYRWQITYTALPKRYPSVHMSSCVPLAGIAQALPKCAHVFVCTAGCRALLHVDRISVE